MTWTMFKIVLARKDLDDRPSSSSSKSNGLRRERH